MTTILRRIQSFPGLCHLFVLLFFNEMLLFNQLHNVYRSRNNRKNHLWRFYEILFGDGFFNHCSNVCVFWVCLYEFVNEIDCNIYVCLTSNQSNHFVFKFCCTSILVRIIQKKGIKMYLNFFFFLKTVDYFKLLDFISLFF